MNEKCSLFLEIFLNRINIFKLQKVQLCFFLTNQTKPLRDVLTHWGTSKLILDFSICFTFQSHVYHTIYRWNLKISSWVLSALICMAWRFVFTHRVAHFPTFVSPPPAPQQNLYSFTIKLLNLTVTSRPILYKIKSTYIQSNRSWWWNHFQRHVMISRFFSRATRPSRFFFK